MPLTQPKTASMVFMGVLLDKYPNRMVWFSLRQPSAGSANPFKIPYAYQTHLKAPARFPRLRLILNYFIWPYFQTFKAIKFGKQHKVKAVLADLAFEAVITGRLTAKWLHLPLLVNIHDDPMHRLKAKGHPTWFINWYKKQFAKTLQAAKRVGVISDYMGESYQETYGVQTTTLFIGVEPDKCLPQISLYRNKKPLIIGSLGSMNSAENWELLVKALDLLNTRYGSGSFKVLHIGNLNPNLLKSGNVEGTGWIPESQFMEQLSRIDAGFLNMSFLSEEQVSSRLSFPLKTNSFIQAQKPIFALGPEDSSVVRFVRDNQCGKVCTANDFISLAEVIEDLLMNASAYKQALLGISRLKNEFSRHNFLAEFESFIQI
jgi:glycosyltransferase involved in cell wall biosynthesis